MARVICILGVPFATRRTYENYYQRTCTYRVVFCACTLPEGGARGADTDLIDLRDYELHYTRVAGDKTPGVQR